MEAREYWKMYHRLKRIFDRMDRERYAPIVIEVPKQDFKIDFDIRMRMPEGPIINIDYAAQLNATSQT